MASAVITLEVDDDVEASDLQLLPCPAPHVMPQWTEQDDQTPLVHPPPDAVMSPRTRLVVPPTFAIQDDPAVHTSASVLLFTFPDKPAISLRRILTCSVSAMALAVNTCNSSAWVVALACSLRLLEEEKRKKK